MNKFSFRRVAGALIAISVVATGASLVATGSFFCQDTGSCLAAASWGFEATNNLSVSQSTPPILSSSDFSFFPHGVQLVSLYAFLLALMVLVFMEFYKPHFLQTLLRPRQRSF